MQLPEWLAEKRGRVIALAAHLNIAPSMVTKMARGEKQVPVEQCPYIQTFTGNAVTCEELRPDKVEYFARIRALSPGPGPADTPAEQLAEGVS